MSFPCARWHEPIRQILIPRQGTEITTTQWKELVAKVPGIGSAAQYNQPSDHCSNMKNDGACDCAETDRALVRQVRRGVYQVL